MHSDVSVEIAYSGEFFVRPLRRHGRDAAPDAHDDADFDEDNPPRDPGAYELVIDNDSGTYRPRKDLLPVLEAFLARPANLGALGRVRAMDGFDERPGKWKEARKEEKKRARGRKGGREPPAVVRQASVSSSGSSSSSSDDEEAHELEEQEARRLQTKARDAMADDDFGLGDVEEGSPDDADGCVLPFLVAYGVVDDVCGLGWWRSLQSRSFSSCLRTNSRCCGILRKRTLKHWR